MSSPSQDGPRQGIRHNLENRVKPPKVGLRRLAAKYLILALPPLIALLGVLCLQLLPLWLLYSYRAFVASCARALVGPDRLPNSDTQTFAAAMAVLITLAGAVHWMRRERKVFPRLPGKKRVCVIGGGISGICVAKESLQAGHEVVLLEKGAQLGGVWKTRAWTQTMTTSSNMNTSFSDFIFPEVFLENSHIGFATTAQFAAYLDSYVRHFKVAAVARLGTTVLSVTKPEGGGDGVTVAWRDTQGQVTEQRFDAVAVCTGLPNQPRPCPLEGAEHFEGSISHSASYTSAVPFKGKRVLVVGTGESASDIVAEVAEVSTVTTPVSVSQHSPVFFLHRDHYEAPPDYAENRLLLLCSAVARSVYLKVLYVPLVLLGGLTTQLHAMPSGLSFLRFLLLYKLPVDPEQPTALCSVLHVTKSGCMLGAITDGTAVHRPKALRCSGGKTIMFEDGTAEDYDEIILANGFCPSTFTMLEGLGLQHSKDHERFNLTFDPAHPEVAFIGFTRGQVGALPTAIEMQARWFALLVSGERRLPSQEAMTARVRFVAGQTRGKYAARHSWVVANYLAENFVLCAPDLLPLLLTRPRVAWKLLTRSFAAWQFRLQGPGAQRELALEAYDSVQLRSNIPGQTAHLAVLLMIAASHGWWFVLDALPLPWKVRLVLNGVFMPTGHESF